MPGKDGKGARARLASAKQRKELRAALAEARIALEAFANRVSEATTKLGLAEAVLEIERRRLATRPRRGRKSR